MPVVRSGIGLTRDQGGHQAHTGVVVGCADASVAGGGSGGEVHAARSRAVETSSQPPGLDLAAGIPQAPVTSTRTVTRTAAFTSREPTY
jgi:hypothetical protein